MVRTASVDKNGLKKGTWTQEEDDKLRSYILRYGHWNWRKLPKFAGLQRCGKSCRLRWMNYLRPDVKRGNFSEEEDDLIIQMHQQLGNKWSRIAMKLPGRTDNDIKNHWHTHLKKRENKKAQPTLKTSMNNQPSQSPQSLEAVPSENLHVETVVSSDSPFDRIIFESLPLSEESCGNSTVWAGTNWGAQGCSMGMFEDWGEDFWTQPLAVDKDDNYNGDGYISVYNSCHDDFDFILQTVQELPQI